MVCGGEGRQQAAGIYSLLPLGVRTFNKLTAAIHAEMAAIGGQCFAMPCLTKAELWRRSGRWDEAGPELIKLSDRRGAEFCLGPTHEEPFTEVIGQHLESWRQLPCRAYQLGRKFRDEVRPRFGLVRAKEFWMKDMYTFDVDSEMALQTYDVVQAAYERLFNRLQLPVMKVAADTGIIGGSLSHEYHVRAAIGDDELVSCTICDFASNVEAVPPTAPATERAGVAASGSACPVCGSGIELHRGIEIGHTFYLGTKYSEVFDATFRDTEGDTRLAEMGCYGIGVSRIMAAAVELFNDDSGIIWPEPLSPYRVVIVVLGDMATAGEAVYDQLEELGLAGDVILDTREMRAGAKLNDADLIGFSYQVIVGGRHDPASLELRSRSTRGSLYVNPEELVALVTGTAAADGGPAF